MQSAKLQFKQIKICCASVTSLTLGCIGSSATWEPRAKSGNEASKRSTPRAIRARNASAGFKLVVVVAIGEFSCRLGDGGQDAAQHVFGQRFEVVHTEAA